MQITISKKTDVTIDIQVPSFYKDDFAYYMINKDGVLVRIYKRSISSTLTDDSFYNANIAEAIKGERIAELDFVKKFSEVEQLITNDIK